MPELPRRDRSDDLAVAAAFGERVHEIRLQQEMTQERLAEAADVHPTFISDIERGYRVPTVATLITIASGLGVRPGDLVNDLDG